MPAQVQKMLELYEQLRQRMGVVVVGPSGSGKSAVWHILRAALGRIQANAVRTYTMNPKAMPRQQLLGRIDVDTREWFDGVLTEASRQVVKEPLDVHSWIICDGDIDPEWIESLNSVLDDNRLLTMPSGERIQFGPNVNFIFETHDLTSASPATISRMGMIFLSEDDVDLPAMVQSWTKQHIAEAMQPQMQDWIEDLFFRTLDWVLAAGHSLAVDQGKVGLTMNGLTQLLGVSNRAGFICALIHGLGAPLEVGARRKLAREVLGWAHEAPPDPRDPLNFRATGAGGLVPYAIRDGDGDELSLDDLLASPLIHTADVTRTADILRPWFENKSHFLLVGPEGCGKSNILLRTFGSSGRSVAVSTLNCNAQTQPEDVIQRLSQSCLAISSNAGRVFRPKEAERLLLYLKDLNLPKPDSWGTSMLVSFVQQLVAYNGFYDSNLEWISLENVQVVVSMNPSTTMGRHVLSTRFTSIVRVLCVTYPDAAQLEVIYSAMLSPVVRTKVGGRGEWADPGKIQKLAGSMVNVYQQLRQRLTRDMHSHYVFTPVFLTRWCVALLRYDLQAVPLLEAWAHAAQRLIRPTLVGEDAGNFDAILNAVLRSDWSTSLDSLKGHVYTSLAPVEASGWRGHARPLTKLSQADYKELLGGGMRKYAREFSDLNLQLFDEVGGGSAFLAFYLYILVDVCDLPLCVGSPLNPCLRYAHLRCYNPAFSPDARASCLHRRHPLQSRGLLAFGWSQWWRPALWCASGGPHAWLGGHVAQDWSQLQSQVFPG
jgi:dynein heavy chain 2